MASRGRKKKVKAVEEQIEKNDLKEQVKKATYIDLIQKLRERVKKEEEKNG